MADPVEIQNVGGLRGVASEATLLELRDSIRELNRGGSAKGNRQLDARLQENYNKSLKSTIEKHGLLDKAIDSTVSSLKGFASEFAFGGNRVGDFAEAIFGAQSSITGLVRYIDSTVDVFRGLSSVGASFNNSIFDMIGAAANSGLELNQYAKFVRENSEIMKVFGGTTTLGAKRFGELSKNLRNSDVGGRLFEMGFTIEDLNEGLANYVDLQVRMGRADTLRTRDLTSATAEYMSDLDALAKVTGKTREEFANIAERIAIDGRVRALADRATADGADNLTKNLAAATAMFPGMEESILNLSAGIVKKDDYIAQALLSSLGPAGVDFANTLKDASMPQEEFMRRISEAAPQISEFLKSMDPTLLAAYMGQDGVAGALGQLSSMGYLFDQAGSANFQAALEEQQRQDRLTSVFTKFENAIINVRKFIVDLFLDSPLAEALGDFGDQLLSLTGNSTGGLTWLQSLLKNAFTKLAGENGILTIAVRWMSDALKPGGALDKGIENLTAWFNNFTTSVDEVGLWETLKNEFLKLFDNIISAIFGRTEEQDTPAGTQTVEVKGLTDLLYEYVFGDETTAPGESLYDRFMAKIGLDTTSQTSVLDQIGTKIYDMLFGKVVGNTRSDGMGEEKRQGGLIAALFGGTNSAGEQTEGLLTSAYEWLKLTLFGGTNSAGNQTEGLLNDAYNWLKLTLFGGTNSAGNQTEGLLNDAFNWIMDTLFPADAPNMEIWDRIIDTIMDGLFEEQVTIPVLGTEIRPGMVALMAKIEKFLNDWLGLSLVQSQTGGPSIWEQILLKIGLDTTGDKTLWQAILEKVGLEQGTPLLEQIQTKIYDSLFGKVVGNTRDDGAGKEIREGGLFKSIIDGFSSLFGDDGVVESLTNTMENLFDSVINGFVNFWNSDKANEMKDIIVGLFNDIQLRILQILDSIPGIGTSGAQGEIMATQGRLDQEALQTYIKGISDATEEGMFDVVRDYDDLGEKFGEDVEAAFREIGGAESWYSGARLGTLLDDMAEKAEAGTLPPEEAEALLNAYRALAARSEEAEENSHAQGTSGFQDFGKKSYATLHGIEAVVPKNSPEGRLLEAFYATQGMTTTPKTQESAPTMAPSSDQSSLIKKVEELNNTMVRVAELLQNSVGLQEKTVKGVRNLNTDFYRGIG